MQLAMIRQITRILHLLLVSLPARSYIYININKERLAFELIVVAIVAGLVIRGLHYKKSTINHTV